jgi:signal transduction histidine kinase
MPHSAPLTSTVSHLLPPARPRLARSESAGHAERLASLGLVTAGVAHELHQPLTYVIGNLGLAMAVLSEAAAADRPLSAGQVADLLPALRDALDGAERMRAIAGELKALASSDEGPAEPVALERVIERALAMARRELQPRAVVERHLAPLPPVAGREGKLVQVFLNLLVNAAHAIPPGQRERHRVVVAATPRPGGCVCVEVSDTGSGIPPERLAQIFDPFFTTKAKGSGSGLGLSISRSIVADLGGTIEVESQVGQGTTVRVLLPAAGAQR